MSIFDSSDAKPSSMCRLTNFIVAAAAVVVVISSNHWSNWHPLRCKKLGILATGCCNGPFAVEYVALTTLARSLCVSVCCSYANQMYIYVNLCDGQICRAYLAHSEAFCSCQSDGTERWLHGVEVKETEREIEKEMERKCVELNRKSRVRGFVCVRNTQMA